jgi:tetratricopeptide (TPR) repeat protein
VAASIGLLALGVRLSHVLLLLARDPMFAHPVRDARWHVEWARALALGLGDGEPFFRAPLYPFFLAGLFELFGAGLLVPRLVQAAIGAAGCVLIWAVGRRLAGPRTGLVAGLVAALCGPLVYFDGEFLIESVFVPLVTASLLLLLRAADRPSPAVSGWPAWALAGGVAGLATIARPNLLLVAVGIVVWIVAELPSWRERAPALVAWLVLFAVPVGGVTAYNAARGGGLVPVASQGGVNFWIGNNPQTDGKTAASPPYRGSSIRLGSRYRDSVELAARLEAEQRLGRKLRASEVSAYWFGQGWEFVRERPAAWLALTAKKTYFLVNGFELPSNRELYPVRRWSPVLALLLWSRPLAFPFGLLFPLALVGMLLAWLRPDVNRSAARLLAIYLVLYGAGVVAFFVTARHRLPLLVALVPFAALALASLPEAVRRFRAQRGPAGGTTAAVALTFLAGAVLSNTGLFDVREYRRTEHRMNLGYALYNEKRYEEALEEFRAVLRDEPSFVRAGFNLGATYLALGRPEQARQALVETLETDPEYADAWVELGRVLAAMGKTEPARQAYRRALSLDPGLALAHWGLALSYRDAWDYDGYLRQLNLAHQSDPDFAPANLALAKLLVEQGRLEEAREHLRRAARVAPDDPRLERLRERIGE